MAVPSIDAATLARSLPMRAAIDALEHAFGAGPVPPTPLRANVETARGTLLVMPATASQGSGVKLVTLTPSNPGAGLPFIHATYVLFDPETQAPRATIDGAALTALRTAAVSGVATRALGRPDARRLVVFGAGVQARSHVEAMRAVRAVEEVVVVSRDPERARAFAQEIGGRVGEGTEVVDADLVCTCTTSETPVLRGRDLPEGVHVNAVGAYTTSTRELDAEAVRRRRVVVETREVALAEAGDLALAVEEGAIGWDHVVADLAETVAGAEVRRSASDRTLFKSVGLAYEDLVVATAAAEAVGA